jgi:hypothetical protein
MRFTLVEGDCLWISPVSFDTLQVGDVVAFDFRGKVVVHRIVGRHAAGFLTQGDGNLDVDSVPLTPEILIGKVLERERAGVRSVVVGGAQGQRRAVVLRVVCHLRRFFLFPLAPCYRELCASRLLSRVWHPQIATVHLNYPEGPITKYVHQGRTVACWIPHEQRWTCRKPYDLILSPPSSGERARP